VAAGKQLVGGCGLMNGDVVIVLVSAALFALFAAAIWLFQEV
jgi:hypothetical protein